MTALRPLHPLLLLPAFLGGCFLFGGGDDEEKREQGAYMEGSSAAGAGAPPGLTEQPADDSGPSNTLPVASLVVSAVTMIGLFVHILRRRPRHEYGP